MKTRSNPLFFVALALSAFTVPTQAGVLYWDGTSTNSDANGGNGTWDTIVTNLNWDNAATAGSDVAWPSVSTLDDDAVFGGIAGTVDVAAGGVTANSLTFTTANYILQGGKITFDGTAPFITNAVAATINSEIAGTASFTKTGAGTLTLGGINTFTGTTTFSGGIVNVTDLTNYGVAGSLGARLAAQETAVGDGIGLHFLGGTLQYTGSIAQSTNRQIRVGTAGAVIDASGTGSGTLSFTHSGANTNLFNTSGTRTITLTGSNAGDNTFAIKVENQGANATSLVKSGIGKWILTNANTYTGTTTINGGTLMLSGGANRLATTGSLAFSGSGTLDLGGNSQTLANLSLTGSGSYIGTVTNGSLSLTGAGNVTISPSILIATAATVDLSGLSSFTVSKSLNNLTLGGNGTSPVTGPPAIPGQSAVQSAALKLSATYNAITAVTLQIGVGGPGSIVNDAVLQLGSANTINATNFTVGSTRSTASVVFQSGLVTPAVTLRALTGASDRMASFLVGVNGAGGTAGNTQHADFSSGAIDARIGTLTVSQGQSGGTTGAPPTVLGTFTMGTGTVDATSIMIAENAFGGGNQLNTGAFNQQAGTVKTGTLTLGLRAGTNTFTALPRLLATYSLGTSTTSGTLFAGSITAGTGTVLSTSARTLNFNNGTIRNFDALTDLTINGSATAAESRINVVLASTGTHTFLADTSRTITLGAFTNVSGTGGTLTKTGAGTLILAGTNSYTGATDVQNGTLQLTSALNAATSLNLGNGSDSGKVILGNAAALAQTVAGFTTTGNGTTNSIVGSAAAVSALTVSFASGTNTFAGKLGGNGTNENSLSLTKAGAGALILSGANTFSGGLTINNSGGSVQIDTLGAQGSGTISLLKQGGSTGSLRLNTSGTNVYTNTFANMLSSAGSMIGSSPNIQNLQGDNTISGSLNINTGGGAGVNIQSDAGILRISGNLTNSGSAFRSFDFSGAGDGVFSGQANDTNSTVGVALIKNGAGTWSVTGTSSNFQGGVSVLQGVLNVASVANTGINSSIGAGGAINLTGQGTSGTLQYTGSAAQSTNHALTVAATGGTLDASGTGSGTLKFTGTFTATDPAGFNLNMTNGSNVVTNTAQITPGTAGGSVMSIAATGLAAGTTITSISGNQYTLSNPFTGTTGAIASTFGASVARTLTLTGSNAGNNEISSTLANSAGGGVLSIAKSGNGTWLLSGANTYTGNTSISSGTLMMGDSASDTFSTGAVSVDSGAKLGGSGAIAGTVGITGILAPGIAGVSGGIGTLAAGTTTWKGAATSAADTIWQFDLSATSNSSDTLAIIGNLKNDSTAGTVYKFDFMNSAPTVWGNVYTLMTWTGTTDFTDASQFSWTNLGGAFDGQPGTGFTLGTNSLTFTAVPEPTSALAGILLGFGLLRRRR